MRLVSISILDHDEGCGTSIVKGTVAELELSAGL